MIIAGEWRRASDGATTEIRNPASGEVVDRAAAGTQQDIDNAIDAAQSAFRNWSSTPPAQRAEIMSRGTRVVKEREKDLARLLTQEQGKPMREAVAEIRRFAKTMEYYAGLAKTLRGGQVEDLDEQRYGMIVKQPIGVCGAILPWNFPVSLMANKIGPALVTGNTMVVKPAPTTPLTDLQIVRILIEAGLPPGVLNVVPGPAEVVGESLLRDPRVRKIAFTGSTKTGKHVMETAATNVKRVTLELGGSDPMIVCDDANIDEAVSGASVGRFFNCGQACIAVKRLYVFDSVFDRFITALVAKVEKLRIGNGLEQGITTGPMHTEARRAEVEAQVDDAVKRGARVLTGNTRPYEQGYFYSPAVLVDVDEQSRMVKEEVFGPALPVMRVKDLDDAIQKSNDTIYGLGSSIWTRDLEKANEAARRLEAGYTWVNSIPDLYDELPFGGVKQSGLGKEHGVEALDYYQETKSVVVARSNRRPAKLS
jgi:succinate-semialdehyde dehydrogenase/glutarate-semialdehyde dehydrogenase